ncbi:MAG: hypothetical protein P8X82_10485 [Gemmatimonadales bacterium]
MTTQPELTLKVWVEDVWGTVSLKVRLDWQVERVKAEALAKAIGTSDPASYKVKYHGALVLDERVSLAEMDIGNWATLTLLAARRRPVR